MKVGVVFLINLLPMSAPIRMPSLTGLKPLKFSMGTQAPGHCQPRTLQDPLAARSPKLPYAKTLSPKR